MNSRERFLSVYGFNAPDVAPLPCLLQYFEAETIRRWQREGLRRDAHYIQYFGYERMELIPVTLGPLPPLELSDVEDSQEWRTGTDREHAEETTRRVDAAREQFPIREPSHWPAMLKRLNPASPARYPRFWADQVRIRKGRDYPLGIQLTGPFSFMHDWIGLHTLGIAVRRDRAWISQMSADLASFIVQAAQRAVTDVDLDFAIIREPWAYQASAIGGAENFQSFYAPFYKPIAAFLRSHGVNAIIVDARGQVADLIPGWIESGVNGLTPIEAEAGLDPRALRQQYGKNLVLIGGIDHQALAHQRRTISDEVLSKVPELLKQGGYFPTPDRPVHAEVSLDNYEYYLTVLRGLNA